MQCYTNTTSTMKLYILKVHLFGCLSFSFGNVWGFCSMWERCDSIVSRGWSAIHRREVQCYTNNTSTMKLYILKVHLFRCFKFSFGNVWGLCSMWESCDFVVHCQNHHTWLLMCHYVLYFDVTHTKVKFVFNTW